MDLKCGHMQQVNSDTTLRPMRPVSDTKLLIPARAVAAPSYESAANGGPVVSTQTLMLQCDTGWTHTPTSQMSQPADTKDSFAGTTGVPLEIRNGCGHAKVSHRENAAYWTVPANPSLFSR